MGWFRKKQKEVAETFVEDATEKVMETVKDPMEKRIKLLLKIGLVVYPIAEAAIISGMGGVHSGVTPTTPTQPINQVFMSNNGTINIYIQKGE